MRWARAAGAVACTVVMPGICALGYFSGRFAYRLVCPVGEAIDAVLFEIEEMTE